MRSRTCVLAVLLAAVALCGCRSRDRDIHAAHLAAWHASGTNPRQQIVASNTTFGLSVLRDLIAQQPDKNVIISPVSLGLALAMTYNEAGTTTRDAIGNTLQVEGLPIDQVNREYQALSNDIRRADRRVEMDIANSLWLDVHWPFEPPFLDLCRRSYDAEVANVEIRSPAAAQAINAWGNKQTRGHIREVEGPHDLDDLGAVALLLSAAYFSGKWTTPFIQGMAGSGPFTLPDGKTRDVQMMAQHGDYLYLESPTLQAISLPYESGRLSFYVLLPRAPVDLNTLCESLTTDRWNRWAAQLAPHPGALKLPRFELQGALSLDDTLKRLGMTDAFAEGRADFTPMSRVGGIWIGGVRQRTYLHVHEKGTEAAVITQMPPLGGIHMPHPDEFSMVVDHPFLCAICDNETGAILFMGAVDDPGNDAGVPFVPRSAKVP